MKLEKICASLLPTRHSVNQHSVAGLSRIVLTIFISVVLGGLAAAQVGNNIATCPFNSPGGNITHVVYIHFDNVHLEQDNPNVPSDLQQMPNLYNFILQNGTMLSNHHTPLIAHTSDDILTTETGVYPDRQGQAIANSFVAVNKSTNKYWDEFPSSFTYWTDPVEQSSTEDTAFSMITAAGANAPAPWVPFTRAGCNVGAVSIANLEMENTNGDIIEIYGKSSPQYKESTTQAALDFEGIAIHCAANNPLCTSANNTACSQALSGGIMGYNGVCAEPDNLPSEPGGYTGYNGLFGHVYVAGAICPTCSVVNGRPTVNDLNGNAMNGFPGFSNISAAQTLGYVAQMLENGVPVVFSYISDLHDCHTALPTCTLTDGYYRALGPGESPYETQIAAYNQAFGEFFQRLQNDGIDSSNTLFIISADEQDHFAGGPATPTGCDGVTTPCNYVYQNGYTPAGNDSPAGYDFSVGEVQGDLTQLLQALPNSPLPASSSDECGPNSGLTNPGTISGCSGTVPAGIFDYHYDMAPAVYFNPYNSSANTATFARQMERATAQLTAQNPITLNTDHLTNYLIDSAGLSALHMITGDPLRTPTYVMFANTDWYFQEQTLPVTQEQDYAYNHGGVAPEINTTWLGLVGPGVANNGTDSTTWTDHTDTRATLLYLTGLTDDYQGDGRVLVEDLVPSALPQNLQTNLQSFEQLAAAYKQMNAPVGAFGQSVLQGSTAALASGSTSSDTFYTNYENTLNALTAQRNALAATIKSQLYAEEYQGGTWNPTSASTETAQANSIRVQGQLIVLNQNTFSANFGQQSVGASAPIQTLTYTFNTPVTLSAVNILTGGQPGLDYTDGGSSTCTAGTAYLPSQTCTVTVAFTPSASGLRSGAVTLFEQTSSTPLAVWYLNGVGQSGAVTIDAGTQTTLGTLSNSGQAYGTAVDGKGNVYVVDNANSQVIELAAGTFTPTTVVSSGLTNPTALALDGAGNLYISNTGANQVVLVPNEQGTLNTSDTTTLTVTGLGSPAGLALDSSGDLYVADTTNGTVWENPAGGAATVAFVSGLTSPSGVAVDNAGNVYVSSANQVTEYPTGGAPSVPIGSGFNTPGALAVDASGAVFVADTGNSRIVRVAPGGASQTVLPATGVSNPQGLALDASFDVFFTTGGSVNEVNRSQSALTFANTNVDSVSAPQTLTISNAGNQTLDFSSVAASANFTVVPSGGTDCTSSTQLASSSQCLVAVEFAPTVSGALTGTLALTDNALGNASSTQTVQLSGGGTQVAQSITFPTIPTQTYGGSPITLNATSSSGLAVSYAVISGPAALSSGNILTITGAGSVTVQASQGGNVEYSAATPVSQTFTVNQASQSITFSTSAPASAEYGSSFPVAATASSGLTPAFTAAGSCSVVDNGNGTATYTMISGTGSCSVQANQSGNANYTAATQVVETTTATLSNGSVAVTSSPNPSTYGQSVTFTATITSDTNSVKGRNGRVKSSVLGGTVTWSANTGCAANSISGYPGTATCSTTALGGGSNTVTATYSGDSNHNGASNSTSQTVNPASQTITLTVPASAAYNSTFTPTATASSNLAVTLTASGGCTVNNGTYTMNSGTTACSVIANQAGNSNYKAAAQVTKSVIATKINPTVSFTGLSANLAYGSTYALTATTTASTTAAITDGTASVCTLSGTTVTIVATSGNCEVTATWPADSNYNGTSLSQTGTAGKGVANITWPAPSPISYGTTLAGSENATATPTSVYPSATYSPAGTKIEDVGTYTLKATFAAQGNSSYTTTTATQSVQVVAASTTTSITSNNLTLTLSHGTVSGTVDFNVTSYKPTGKVTLTASGAGLPTETCEGMVSSSTGDGDCKLTFTQAGDYTVTASYPGDANHNPSTNSGQTSTITVNP
jgi:sugar lactone lactonase YvrE